MKESKPYWRDNMAYSMEPYIICLHFPNMYICHNTPDKDTLMLNHYLSEALFSKAHNKWATPMSVGFYI